jgi:hypothetical protein
VCTTSAASFATWMRFGGGKMSGGGAEGGCPPSVPCYRSSCGFVGLCRVPVVWDVNPKEYRPLETGVSSGEEGMGERAAIRPCNPFWPSVGPSVCVSCTDDLGCPNGQVPSTRDACLEWKVHPGVVVATPSSGRVQVDPGGGWCRIRWVSVAGRRRVGMGGVPWP